MRKKYLIYEEQITNLIPHYEAVFIKDAKEVEVLDDAQVKSFINDCLLSANNFTNALNANKYLIVKIVQ